MSYFNDTMTLECGCYVDVEADVDSCFGHGPDEYCYCYGYAEGLQKVSIDYCKAHGGS